MAVAVAKKRGQKNPGANGRLSQIILTTERGSIQVPADVIDLKSFLTWIASGRCPEATRVSYIGGIIWVDPAMEQGFLHNILKLQIGGLLLQLVRQLGIGYYFGDGMQLTNEKADLSTVTDGMLVTKESLAAGKVELTAGASGGVTMVLGGPDMVLEIVSESSGEKDTLELMTAYFNAGVAEYWLVDVRKGQCTLSIHKAGRKGFSKTKSQSQDWIKSTAFGREFRLTRGTDDLSNPVFDFQVR